MLKVLRLQKSQHEATIPDRSQSLSAIQNLNLFVFSYFKDPIFRYLLSTSGQYFQDRSKLLQYYSDSNNYSYCEYCCENKRIKRRWNMENYWNFACKTWYGKMQTINQHSVRCDNLLQCTGENRHEAYDCHHNRRNNTSDYICFIHKNKRKTNNYNYPPPVSQIN